VHFVAAITDKNSNSQANVVNAYRGTQTLFLCASVVVKQAR
jgi:hypothetical protein